MKKLIPSVAACALYLSGCITDEPGSPSAIPTRPSEPELVSGADAWTPEQNARFRGIIEGQGFNPETIVDLGNAFSAEGDVLFPKTDLLDKAVPLAKGAQYRSQYAVRDNKYHNIQVLTDPSLNSATAHWDGAMQNGCWNWNKLELVKFVPMFSASAPDILIKKGSGTYAAFPNSAGAPGAIIYINKSDALSNSAKINIVTHLLGHAMGLHHTNNTAENGNNPYGLIPQTPTSEAASIMNSGIPESTPFTDFSAGDKRAVRGLYSSILRPTVSNPYRFMARANGDNRDDQIFWDEDGIWVSLANSNGTFAGEKRWTNSDMAWTNGTLDAEEVRLVGDINGDGIADALYIKRDRIVGATSATGYDGYGTSTWGTQMTYNDTWRTASNPRMLADVNGDGKADLVGFGNSAVHVAISTGYSFQPLSIWSTNFGPNLGWNAECPRIMADVNKDGAADIVGFALGGVIVAISNKAGGFVQDAYWTSNYGYNEGWRSATHIRDVVDVTGDGYPDIVGFKDDGVYVGINTFPAFKTFGKLKWTDKFGGWDKTKYLRYLADVNGDGRKDIVGFGGSGTEVGLSNGTTAFNYASWNSDFGYAQGWRIGTNTRMTGDVDGDGKSDIICNTPSEGIVGTSKGSYFSAFISY